MAGYRDQFHLHLGKLSARVPMSALIKISGQKLIFPVYHLVSDQEVPHINYLYTVKNSASFLEDLHFLLGHFEPIDLPRVLKHLDGSEPLTRPSFFLTFDDGLQEFYSIVAPILISLGIPAMNFLNSAFIDNHQLFHRYKVSLILHRLAQSANPAYVKEIGTLVQTKSNNEDEIKNILLKLNYEDTALIDRLGAIVDLDFNHFLQSQKPYLSSDQIRELIKKGFEFGAHSIDHPLYGSLPLAEQIRQTDQSITAINQEYNLQYRTFAFPFTDFNVSRRFFDYYYHQKPRLDLSFGSAGLKKDIYHRHLQRIPMEMGSLPAHQIIHAEYLYYLLKQPLGKNKISRL